MDDDILRPVPQDDRVRDIRLPVRLYTSKYAHRLIPARVALAIAAAVGTPGQRHDKATERRQAEHLMKDLLLHTPRAGEARELARRNVVEAACLRELFWRPWLLKRSRVIGQEHWHAAHAGGRGCLVVVGHLGGLFALAPVLWRHGFGVISVATPDYWAPMPPGFLGRFTLRLRDYAEAFGQGHAIPSNVAPEVLVELLERGESVLIAFDMPGTAATPFLGRSIALAGGPATLAFRTGVRVLPVLPARHGSRIDVRLYEPLDPADHRDAASLRAAIAAVFERVVLAHPEIVDFTWYPSPLVTEVPPDAPPAEAMAMEGNDA
ncbi:MAG TPA: lysophospholipid acyltransferase family protein [Baekduia sp.]|nr:lysophospholipid acyltransferase family protein [Baekduia sp.]